MSGINSFKHFQLTVTTSESDEREEKKDVEKDHQAGTSAPLVFALTAWDAGRKVVDYYMTWRGKTVRDSLLLLSGTDLMVRKFRGHST